MARRRQALNPAVGSPNPQVKPDQNFNLERFQYEVAAEIGINPARFDDLQRNPQAQRLAQRPRNHL